MKHLQVPRHQRPSDGVLVPRSIGPADVESLIATIRRRLPTRRVVACDVRAVTTPDAGTIDALARVQLRARRLGGTIELRNACPALVELIELAGLRDVLPGDGSLRREPRRKTEQRKEALGVEEEGDPGDPIA
ncbi:MAG TPA: STAS domain-containing protein [Candidatus Limnocylindrales bacterium]|nr:STAS domain-containing protein [Candidatus Limnocylindrales bacterium]